MPAGRAKFRAAVLFTRSIPLLLDIADAPGLVRMPKVAAGAALANVQIMLTDFLSESSFRFASLKCLRIR